MHCDNEQLNHLSMCNAVDHFIFLNINFLPQVILLSRKNVELNSQGYNIFISCSFLLVLYFVILCTKFSFLLTKYTCCLIAMHSIFFILHRNKNYFLTSQLLIFLLRNWGSFHESFHESVRQSFHIPGALKDFPRHFPRDILRNPPLFYAKQAFHD